MGDLGTISPYVALEGAGTLISILVSFSLSTPATSNFSQWKRLSEKPKIRFPLLVTDLYYRL